MAIINDINLLQAKTLISPYIRAIEKQLRAISVVLLGTVALSGLVIGSGYVILNSRHKALIQEKEYLLAEIRKRAEKEILYRAVKTRIQDIQEVFDARISLHEIVDDVTQIAEPPTLRSASINSDGSISVRLETDSIYDAMGYTEKVLALSNEDLIVNPVLDNFLVDDSIRFSVNVRFTSTRK